MVRNIRYGLSKIQEVTLNQTTFDWTTTYGSTVGNHNYSGGVQLCGKVKSNGWVLQRQAGVFPNFDNKTEREMCLR